MWVGAAYVPVDADDPDERAKTVFTEAQVAGIIKGRDTIVADAQRPSPSPTRACLRCKTTRGSSSPPGSTGKPKGVAVTHRSAAAFVDAEAKMFLPGNPLNTSDRVLAGLSVAFDASCEEMWIAWRNGSCLVPAPRALVRSGMDLGPWLISRSITAVSHCAHPGRAVAGPGPGFGTPADLRRRSLPARTGPAPGHRRP